MIGALAGPRHRLFGRFAQRQDRPFGRGASAGDRRSLPGVQANGESRSLLVTLRVGVAAVVVAAFLADYWVNVSWRSGPRSREVMAATACIAAAGLAWTLLPRLAPVAAVGAAVVSLLLTANLSERLRFPFFTELALLPLLFGVVLGRRAPWRWPVAALLVASGTTVCLRSANHVPRNIVGLTAVALFAAAAGVVGYLRMKEDERRAGEELARRSERLDLARELHDVVGHHLTGIVVLVQASRFAASGGRSDELDTGRALADIERAGAEALTSVRRLVGLLRDDSPTSAGPQPGDIEQIVDDLRTTHPRTQLAVDPLIRASWVPDDLATTVHRIVQEAATNVRKHGEASEPVIVALRRAPGRVEVEVQNRCRAREPGHGFGLVGMRERVEALGGHFAAGPAGDSIWIVHATLPVGMVHG